MSGSKDNQQQSSNLGKIAGGLLLGGAAIAAAYFGGKYLSEQLEADEEAAQQKQRQQPSSSSNLRQTNNNAHAQPRASHDVGSNSSDFVKRRRCTYCTKEVGGCKKITLGCGHQYHSDCLVQLFVQEGQRVCDCGYRFNQKETAEIKGNSNYDDCFICTRSIELSDLITLECNHHFHRECLQTLIQFGLQRQCSVCRRKLAATEVRMILSRNPQ